LTLRRANKDTWLPSGGGEDGTEKLLLHKGERVVISIYGAQRDPANFGDDASEFNPERWEHLSVNTPGFLAFSMGPRLCAGSKTILTLE
jgi:cytochrome P450